MKRTVLCYGTYVLVCIGFLCVHGRSTQTQGTKETNAPQRQAQAAASPCCVYDPNPSHIWNRLYAALLIREDPTGIKYGTDSLDPLLWPSTKYLLAQPSHGRALRILDEFLQTHAESLIHDPVKRAILQRDLWAVFDWSVKRQGVRQGEPSYDGEKRELQIRLAEVLRRLALTPQQIESLPNNYAQAVASGEFAKEYDPAHRDRAFLPPDLFEQHGPWVAVSGYPEPVATAHASAFSRSSFLVFVRLPGGRKATFDYFHTLWDFPQPWIPRPDTAPDQTVINPDLPQFPAGTEVALIRQMMLFDNQGNLVATPVTESVQIRVYRAIAKSGQDCYEIRLSRPQLFGSKSGGLRAIASNEKEFFIFNFSGPDEHEVSPTAPWSLDKYLPVLEECVACHRGIGIDSLNSRSKFLKPNWLQHDHPAEFYEPVHNRGWWEGSATLNLKENRYDWGLLNGYWKASGGLH